jgi:hypothetical protein
VDLMTLEMLQTVCQHVGRETSHLYSNIGFSEQEC